MKKHILSVSVLSLAFAVSGAAVAAPGQPAAGQQSLPQQQQQQPSSSDFTDKQVAQFAKVQKKVNNIRAKYRKLLMKNSKDNPKKAMQVRAEAQKKMADAVNQSGLDIQTYNKMAGAAMHDPDLQKRIKKAE